MIAKLIISTLAFYFSAWLLPGITIDGYWTAFIAAVVLAVLNTYLKPVLQLLSLPITIITMGLFLWIINTVIIMVVASFVSGFHVDGFGWGMIFSAVLTFTTSVLNAVFDTNSNSY